MEEHEWEGGGEEEEERSDGEEEEDDGSSVEGPDYINGMLGRKGWECVSSTSDSLVD